MYILSFIKKWDTIQGGHYSLLQNTIVFLGLVLKSFIKVTAVKQVISKEVCMLILVCNSLYCLLDLRTSAFPPFSHQ